MKKRNRILFALTAAGAIAAGSVSPVCLNSNAGAAPMPDWEGVDSSEIVLLSETPVEVLHETLTLETRGSADEFLRAYDSVGEEYPARYTAEYTLYNPTDEEQTLRLACELGRLPDYMLAYAEDSCESLVSLAADGETIQPRVRYAYGNGGFEEETDPFFTPETPITGRTVEVSLPAEREKDVNYLLRAECEFNPLRTKLIAPHNYRYSRFENGKVAVYVWLWQDDEVVSFGSLGEEVKISSFSVLQYDWEHSESFEGARIQEGKAKRTTVGESVKAFFPDQPAMSEEEAFRCAAQCFAQAHEEETGVIEGAFRVVPSQLQRRFEYELTVPAGGRITHTVRAPLFPQVGRYGCEYAYRFSNAYGWARFGGISVEIRTDGASKLSESNFNFDASSGAFRFSGDSLPMGKLSFALSPISVNCSPEDSGGAGGLSRELIVAFAILGVLAAGGIGFAAFALVRKKRRKANEQRGNS